MEEAKRKLGKRVRYLRRLKNFTQAQLAERIGLSVNYISQIETGLATPSFETLYVLAVGLEEELKSLFDFELRPVTSPLQLEESTF